MEKIMLRYPFNLLDQDIYPILGNQFKGLPLYLDWSSNSKLLDMGSTKETDDYIQNTLLKQNNRTWSVGGYLEEREKMLSAYPQYVRENRIYHMGLDINVPAKTKLYAPLDGEIVISDYEEEEGSYGALTVLKHNVNNVVFYSLFGHLNKSLLPKVGTKFKKGDVFEEVGDFQDNGNWEPHTHLQVFTELGYKNEWIHRGYCRGEDLKIMRDICPNPIFLLKVEK
jgi:hypothetical protein